MNHLAARLTVGETRSVAVPGHSNLEHAPVAGTVPTAKLTDLAAPEDGRTPALFQG